MADDANSRHLNDFILEHAPLINLHLKKLRNAGKIPEGVEDEDLHLAGVHGLMDAVNKYDPKSEASFSAYAGSRIRGKMLDHVVTQDHIPKSIRRAAKQVKE